MSKSRVEPSFEEVCWIYDKEADHWVMPLSGRAPALPGKLIREASQSSESRNDLIALLEEVKCNYQDSDRFVDPIIERLKTARPH